MASLNFESLVHLTPIPGVIVRDPVTGKPGVAPIRSDFVVNTAGKTVDEMLAEGLAGAINGLQNGDLKTLSDSLKATHKLVDDFINCGADGGTMDRLVELVTQINANKDSIDLILNGKIDVSAIVNDLTTGGTDKVLSAEQGKALKALIDALQTSLEQQLANVHTHANKDAVLDKLTAVDGALQFNGAGVGETRHWTSTVTEVPTVWPTNMHPNGLIILTPTANHA